jgi:hypothetical protein
METEGSLPHSQEPSVFTYPEPHWGNFWKLGLIMISPLLIDVRALAIAYRQSVLLMGDKVFTRYGHHFML